jgi:hypothetical protein
VDNKRGEHSSPLARSLGAQQASLPVTDHVSQRLLRLPMYYDLSDREVGEIARRVSEFYDCRPSVPAVAKAAGSAREQNVRGLQFEQSEMIGFGAFPRIRFTPTEWPHVTESIRMAPTTCVGRSPASFH